jgi:acetoin utilization protein AcuC
MPENEPILLYADAALGAYGWDDKPWFPPHVRLQAFREALERDGLLDRVSEQRSRPATDAELHAVHSPEHVARVTRQCASGRGSVDVAPHETVRRTREVMRALSSGQVPAQAWMPFLRSQDLVDEIDGLRLSAAGRAFLDDPDAPLGGPTYARPHVERAARHVCGAVLDATRRVLDGDATRAFVAIAGFHHAHRDVARMMCLYNDAALAIAEALDRVDGIVAYVDIDVHHGDGVHAIHGGDRRVALVDLHGGGDGAGWVARPELSGMNRAVGTKLGIAVERGAGDGVFLDAWAHAEAFLRAADPDVVIFEAGVDGLATDPMSSLALTPAAIRAVTERVVALADDLADGRLIGLGGGGYGPDSAAAWAEVVGVLVGRRTAAEGGGG